MKEIPMKLIICGNGNVFENCIKLSRDLGLDKKIKFEGLVPPEQLQQFTQDAYIGINLVEPSGLNQYIR
jgi:glycosyltransferase involved in cell wall biosynthesis